MENLRVLFQSPTAQYAYVPHNQTACDILFLKRIMLIIIVSVGAGSKQMFRSLLAMEHLQVVFRSPTAHYAYAPRNQIASCHAVLETHHDDVYCLSRSKLLICSNQMVTSLLAMEHLQVVFHSPIAQYAYAPRNQTASCHNVL